MDPTIPDANSEIMSMKRFVLKRTELLNCSGFTTICCAILSIYNSSKLISGNCFNWFSITVQKRPSVFFSMFLFVIATSLFMLYFLAHSIDAETNLLHPLRVIWRIAIAASSDIWTSIPEYNPSVASLKQTKSRFISGVKRWNVLTGLILEYNSNFCLNVTATLLGALGFGIVVVGPLKHVLAFSSCSIVESGIYDLSLQSFFAHCSEPASQWISSDCKLHSFNTCSIPSTISGPIPSPFIITAFLDMMT